MKNKILIGAMTFITVVSTSIAITASIKVVEFKSDVVTLKEKLENTDGANKVLVEQVKRLIIGGR